MPVDGAGQRCAIGHYQMRQLSYVTDSVIQKKLNGIAASQAKKHPQKCSSVSVLYAMALLLPHLKMVVSSSQCLDTIPMPSGQKIGECSVIADQSLLLRKNSGEIAQSLTAESQPAELLYSANLAASNFLSLPQAQATPAGAFLDVIRWDENDQFLIADSPSTKGLVLGLAKLFLLRIGDVSKGDAEALEFDWRMHAADAPLLIAPVADEFLFARQKRISMDNVNKQITEHIKDHCAFETEILNSDGLSEGKLLILSAQRAENPFRLLYDSNSHREPSPFLRNTANVVNFSTDVLTLGIKPFFGNLIANYYRWKYYDSIDDKICATRQLRLSIAQIATALEVDGLRFTTGRETPHQKSVELMHVIPVENRAAYYAHNKANNVERELLVTASRNDAAGNQVESVLLKKGGDAVFETYQSRPVNAKKMGKQVLFDDQIKIWRYADESANNPLKLEVREGNDLIAINGEKYVLHVTEDMQHEIVLMRANGIKEFVPVFFNPLSKTWHLATQNRHPSFTPQQKMLIESLQVKPDSRYHYLAIDNPHPEFYGAGKIFEVRNRGDDIASTAPHYLVVEMNGALVPVRAIPLEKHGIRFDAYDMKFPEKNGYPIEWEKDRWLLERWTSPHISKSVKEYVTSDMYALTVNANALSAADQQGIRWSKDNLGYIKVKKHFVPIQLGKLNFLGQDNNKKIFIQYRNHQFHRSELEKRNRSDSIADRFYGKIKELSTSSVQEGIIYLNLGASIQAMFPSENVEVEQIPSIDLDTKRYLVAIATEQFILETSVHDQRPKPLSEVASEQALAKYRQSASGGKIKHVLALRRYGSLDDVSVRDLDKMNQITAARIQTGVQEIRDVLARQKKYDAEGRSLILCHADFLQTAAFGSDVFSSPEAVYLALNNYFIPLSKDNPDAIIVPGSLHISSSIPEKYQTGNNLYKQGNVIRNLGSILSFSATIAPVFYDGRLITIARKGEYLRYQFPDQPEEQDEEWKNNPIAFSDLDQGMPAGTILTLGNYSETDTVPQLTTSAHRTGTIFSGKTFIPFEKKVLQWLFCPCQERQGRQGVEAIFGNEFMIDDEKFLLIIEDEFEQHDNFKPSVRLQVLSQNENLDEAKCYDWILHPSSGAGLDKEIRSVGDNYLHADRGMENEFVSETHPRMQIRAHAQDENLIVYDYQGD